MQKDTFIGVHVPPPGLCSPPSRLQGPCPRHAVLSRSPAGAACLPSSSAHAAEPGCLRVSAGCYNIPPNISTALASRDLPLSTPSNRPASSTAFLQALGRFSEEKSPRGGAMRGNDLVFNTSLAVLLSSLPASNSDQQLAGSPWPIPFTLNYPRKHHLQRFSLARPPVPSTPMIFHSLESDC